MRFRTTILAMSAMAGALAGCGAPPADEATPDQTAAATSFVGLWGADEAQCADPAWRFAADEVSTRGEVHCAFTQVTRAGDQYAVRAMCTAEAPPAPYDITLQVSESPHVMVVSGGPWAGPIRLVYCAPQPAE
ncbi:MAG TPA: hypothetical protein PLS69_14615 [Terricaulis sp.]|nr:hypothetical protein [Terricaulis sp.]HRP10990.1 hypothetical protein [Terricaulis sp.]